MNPAQNISDNFETLKNRLVKRHKDAKTRLHLAHPHIKKLLLDRGLDLGRLRHHSVKLLTAGTLGGALLLNAPDVHAQLPNYIFQSVVPTSPVLDSPPEDWLVEQMQLVLPPITDPWNLPFISANHEKSIGKIIERATGVPAVPTLEGEHLNTTYGYIGAEQHLRRWPGDDISQHGELAHVEGMAPGNGGFGFFAKGLSDTGGIEREKYYVAVQTLYLPDWDTRWKYLVGWYKWRKIVVVNPDNGHTVVAVVGDAGPAAWTGKHFGGSPEVMHELGGKRYKKGRVLLYFVDDPQNKVPLGPVVYDYTKILGFKLTEITSFMNSKNLEIANKK